MSTGPGKRHQGSPPEDGPTRKGTPDAHGDDSPEAWDAADYASPWEREEAALRDSADWLRRGDDAVVFSMADEPEARKRSSEAASKGERAFGDRGRRKVRRASPSSATVPYRASRGGSSRSVPPWLLPGAAAGVVLIAAWAVVGALRGGHQGVSASLSGLAPGKVSAAPALPRGEHHLRAAPGAPADSALALIRPTGLAGRILGVMSAADSDVARELEGLRSEHGLPPRPPRVWLEGAYLASAGEHPEVVEYWQGVQRFLIHVRDTVPEMVRNAYRLRLEESEFSSRTSGILLEEALIAFADEQGPRSRLFGRVEEVARAALDLHDFLVARADSIDHDPFTTSGLTRDPILEVAPASEDLGQELWDRLDRVFEALDAVGALEDPDTAMLVDYLIQGLREQVNPGVDRGAESVVGTRTDQEG